jgi:hypothetical protein
MEMFRFPFSGLPYVVAGVHLAVSKGLPCCAFGALVLKSLEGFEAIPSFRVPENLPEPFVGLCYAKVPVNYQNVARNLIKEKLMFPSNLLSLGDIRGHLYQKGDVSFLIHHRNCVLDIVG